MRTFALLLILALSIPATAAQSNKEQKITELVKVMNMDAMMDSMYAQMTTMMQNMSGQMGVTAQEKPIFDRYYEKMVAVMKEEMSWQKLEPEFVKIYAKNFSIKEIDDMLVFYKTESGQSILKKMPSVMQESMLISQGFAQAMVPKIQAISEELSQELQAARGN